MVGLSFLQHEFLLVSIAQVLLCSAPIWSGLVWSGLVWSSRDLEEDERSSCVLWFGYRSCSMIFCLLIALRSCSALLLSGLVWSGLLGTWKKTIDRGACCGWVIVPAASVSACFVALSGPALPCPALPCPALPCPPALPWSALLGTWKKTIDRVACCGSVIAFLQHEFLLVRIVQVLPCPVWSGLVWFGLV